MEQNPSGVQHNDGPHKASSRKHHHCPVDETGDSIKCSGKCCRSCTAGMVADCVAICCCPFAVVNFLALAFIKAPWMMGRRCLGLGKKKRQGMERKRKCEERSDSECEEDRYGNCRKGRVEDGTWEILRGLEVDEEQEDNFEADRVWLELYQLGHLGFGRVSFTGIQSQR
ncbi:uncharacterized protein LOC132281366 [Cornus florida]|uniref:uncharacterized protein LOC132281366 n=1 Tax=Cornus florida TaxID=4283 RepID=UPI0028A06D79|nr:uncharacterized protein LOC132281366 [Cornus florida]